MIPAAGQEPSRSCQALCKESRRFELLWAAKWKSPTLADNLGMIHALAKRARALGVSESQAFKAILTRCLLMQFPLFVVVGVIKKLPKKKKNE